VVKRDRTEIWVGKNCYAAAARKGGCAKGRRVKNVLQPSKKGCTPNPGCPNYLSSIANNSKETSLVKTEYMSFISLCYAVGSK